MADGNVLRTDQRPRFIRTYPTNGFVAMVLESFKYIIVYAKGASI